MTTPPPRTRHVLRYLLLAFVFGLVVAFTAPVLWRHYAVTANRPTVHATGGALCDTAKTTRTRSGLPKLLPECGILPKPDKLYDVIRVYDGDTIHANVDGFDTALRLIGLDTPELKSKRTKKPECFGENAADEARTLLQGKTVRIELDRGSHWDEYRRLLAYVYLPDGRLYQEHMIRNGLGHEYTYNNRAYEKQKLFRDAEEEARRSRRGMHRDPACVAESLRKNNTSKRSE